jgi:hypothetical protein
MRCIRFSESTFRFGIVVSDFDLVPHLLISMIRAGAVVSLYLNSLRLERFDTYANLVSISVGLVTENPESMLRGAPRNASGS